MQSRADEATIMNVGSHQLHSRRHSRPICMGNGAFCFILLVTFALIPGSVAWDSAVALAFGNGTALEIEEGERFVGPESIEAVDDPVQMR